MNVRRLCLGDYHKGFLDVVGVFCANNDLQKITSMSFENFADMYERIESQSGVTFVIELDDKIVATAKALYEYKFHHPLMGHIEDVAVHPQYRKLGLGQRVVEHAIQSCWDRGCYKVTLACREDLEAFYSRTSLTKRGITMNAYKTCS